MCDLRIRVGMVFQSQTRSQWASTRTWHTAYVLKVSKTKKHIDEVVGRFPLRSAARDEVKDRLKAHAFGLSGGQQLGILYPHVPLQWNQM